MSTDSSLIWFEANQRYLTLRLTQVASLLENQAGDSPKQLDDSVEHELAALAATMDYPPAIESLCSLFGLSHFERDILLVCAGVELDSRFNTLPALQPSLTFSLMLFTLPEAHWSALTPAAALRRWRLVEIGSGMVLVQRPLKIDERILHFLTGTGGMDERLVGYVESVQAVKDPIPSHQLIGEQIATAWMSTKNGRPLLVIQIIGQDAADRQQVAVDASVRVGLNLCVIRADAIPANPVEADTLIRLWEREAVLSNQVLLLIFDNLEATHATRWIETARFPLIISTRERISVGSRKTLTFEIRKPTVIEQRDLWLQALGPDSTRVNGKLDTLAAHFNLGMHSIEIISSDVLQTTKDTDNDLGEALWSACRAQSHPQLGELAQHIQSMAYWEDLVLPEQQIRTLHEVAVHVRQRMKVYETWGFAAKCTRGLGISALFAGVSGTGKTMAAEVLANELQLDLYRIDLSQVVSKYIGETEKNLRRVFDAAEEGGAILLFDEADALFGKRSEVKDSHDRYSNVEISYLLQRMEAYRGLAILTTNLKDAIDTAFMRRIRFLVHFPFPDTAQRTEIWRRIFPPQTPTENLDVERLARLSVTGGNIRNIALHAAFLAADAGESVRMSHLLQAARAEYTKLEKPLSEAEIGGWV
ncbi:MAG: ATP-binding protein [Anaerolineaceae bacterium]|nr:ATP-binding protein [Anaerolineaceae bacterium]